MPTYMVVQRPFRAAGEDRVTGEVVAVDGWRNVDSLLTLRHLRPIDREKDKVTKRDGRIFLKEAQAATK